MRCRREMARRVAWAAVKRAMPVSTGPARVTRKAGQAAHRRQVIAETRQAVFARDGACRMTGFAAETDECHEVVSRAHTRGMPPEARWNTRNCLRLSRAAHAKVTAHTVEIVFVDEVLGCDGGILFRVRQSNGRER